MTTEQQNRRITSAEETLDGLMSVQESIQDTVQAIQAEQKSAADCRTEIRTSILDLKTMVIQMREEDIRDREDRTDKVTVKLRTSTTVKIFGAAAATTILALATKIGLNAESLNAIAEAVK